MLSHGALLCAVFVSVAAIDSGFSDSPLVLLQQRAKMKAAARVLPLSFVPPGGAPPRLAAAQAASVPPLSLSTQLFASDAPLHPPTIFAAPPPPSGSKSARHEMRTLVDAPVADAVFAETHISPVAVSIASTSTSQEVEGVEVFSDDLTSVPRSSVTDVRPRMLVMSGCSGSSVIMDIAKKLMRRHGLAAASFQDGTELLKPEKNKFFKKAHGDGATAIRLTNADAVRRGGLLMFKAMSTVLTEDKRGVSWEELVPALKQMHTRVVYGQRRNVLDHAVCKVRDCFADGYGVPVNGATGEQSSLCFERRDSDSQVLYQAKMHPFQLLKMLSRTEELMKTDEQIVRAASLNDFETLFMEDLLEFQYQETKDVSISVRAWKSFLTAWGVKPDESIIVKFLTSFADKRHKPGSHRDVIYNFEEVAAALVKGNMTYYLRK